MGRITVYLKTVNVTQAVYQISFSEAEYRNKRRKTRKEKFLEQMDSEVWLWFYPVWQ